MRNVQGKAVMKGDRLGYTVWQLDVERNMGRFGDRFLNKVRTRRLTTIARQPLLRWVAQTLNLRSRLCCLDVVVPRSPPYEFLVIVLNCLCSLSDKICSLQVLYISGSLPYIPVLNHPLYFDGVPNVLPCLLECCISVPRRDLFSPEPWCPSSDSQPSAGWLQPYPDCRYSKL